MKTWITATQALYLVGEFTAGKTVLWHAGASSVSISGIQLSIDAGATAVYATARQDEKCDFCVNTLKCKAAFNTTKCDWADEVLKATDGKGVDLIIDFIGADVFQGNLDAIARDGRIVSLGMMSGTKLKEGTDILKLLYKRVRWEGSTLRSRDTTYQKKLRDQLVDHALPRFRDGTFKVIIDKNFAFEDIVEAHKYLASNQSKGKLICTIK
jgi:NADPH:quinone reductase-like Zn-dependent oxidoreductase